MTVPRHTQYIHTYTQIYAQTLLNSPLEAYVLTGTLTVITTHKSFPLPSPPRKILSVLPVVLQVHHLPEAFF